MVSVSLLNAVEEYEIPCILSARVDNDVYHRATTESRKTQKFKKCFQMLLLMPF
jgi:hypothetical protein